MFSDCTETIPLFMALIRGTDGACIDLSVPSVIAMVAGFMAAVIAIKFIVTLIIRQVFSKPETGGRASASVPAEPLLREKPHEGPIRSTRTM